METVLVAVGLWCLLACAVALLFGGAAGLGDELWRAALDEESDQDWQWPDRRAT